MEAGTAEKLAPAPRSSIIEVGAAFLKLGTMSFGGPVAHLSYLRAEFVTKRKWIDDAEYADLVALCQFLPGPASSQVVFALGMKRAGLLGAFAASLCFTLPSALLMIAFGYGVASIGDLRQAGWLHGLKLAAVAVVAQAVWGMGRRLCPDRQRITICLIAAAVIVAVPRAFEIGPIRDRLQAISQIAAIALGALIGWRLYRTSGETPSDEPKEKFRAHVVAGLALFIYFALLFLTPFLAATTGSREVAQFDSFYRAGSLVFGGGHVVLPLLRAELVPRGWLTDDQFLAGYGAAQAVPGPLFTFSAYLGTVMSGGPHAWLGGLWCLFAIFLPAWLLIGGALPFWHSLRSKSWAQAALLGANAAVVGVLLAALYSPVMTEGIKRPLDVAAALIAFVLLEVWKAPPWLVVLLMACAGQWAL